MTTNHYRRTVTLKLDDLLRIISDNIGILGVIAEIMDWPVQDKIDEIRVLAQKANAVLTKYDPLCRVDIERVARILYKIEQRQLWMFNKEGYGYSNQCGQERSIDATGTITKIHCARTCGCNQPTG